MVALVINWMTFEPSQDAGPGLGPRVRRSSQVGNTPEALGSAGRATCTCVCAYTLSFINTCHPPPPPHKILIGEEGVIHNSTPNHC